MTVTADTSVARETASKASKSLIAYRRIMLSIGDGEVTPAPFHNEWSDLLLFDNQNVAIEGFRESGKTQYALRAFLLYAFTFPDDSRDYIVLIKKNATLARAKLKEIEHEYTTNALVSANMVEIREASGEVFSVDGKNEILLITGSGPKENLDSVLALERLQNTRGTYTNESASVGRNGYHRCSIQSILSLEGRIGN